MEITINVYPQQQNVEIVTEPNVTNINVTTYAVINPQVYDLSEFTNTEVDRFAKLSDIVSSIAGYATEAWVNSRGFITNVITALGFTPENVANKNTSTSLGTSDSLYPTQNAVKTYVDTGLSVKQDSLGFTPENVANKENATLDTSNTKYPTNKLVKEAVDAKQNSLGFTPENVANKTTNIGNTDVNSYPNTPTVKSALDAKQDTLTNITQIANRSYNDLQDLPSPIDNITEIPNRSYNDLQGLPVIPTINYLNVTPSDEVDSTSLVLVESIPLEQILMESNLEALLTIECMLIEVTAGLVNIRIEVRLRGETEPNHVLLATAQSSSASIRQMNFQREIIIRDNNLITVQTNSTLLTNIGAQSTAPTVEIPIFNDDAHYLDIFIRRTGTGGTPGTVQKLSTKLTLEKQNL
jgi:hypothetical protein